MRTTDRADSKFESAITSSPAALMPSVEDYVKYGALPRSFEVPKDSLPNLMFCDSRQTAGKPADTTMPPAEKASAAPKDNAAAHDLFMKNAERLVSDINCSNKVMEQAPRAVAESALRVLSIGMWDGTGISQHKNWQKDMPARRDIVNPTVGADGKVNVDPTKWDACFKEVQNHRDQLNRKWGNCSEQAASLAHVFHDMINDKNNPQLADAQVRQAYGAGHSWTEVRYGDGKTVVYDPWSRTTGAKEEMPAKYRENVNYTDWYGRKK